MNKEKLLEILVNKRDSETNVIKWASVSTN